MSGRRVQIDWEAVERDYRVGQLSVREIARRHSLEASSITRKAKKESWTRDYTEEVRARTRAGLVEIAKQQAAECCATESNESNNAVFGSLEIAVESNLRVLRSHQIGIRDNAERLSKLTQKFDTLSDSAADLNDMSKAAASFESLVRAQKTLVALEREALNIDDDKLKAGSGDINISF